MKLSDIKGERTLDVIAEVIEPIANLAEDKDVTALFTRQRLPQGMTANEFLIARIKKAAPKLLKKHKEDVIAILATIEGISPQEYGANLNLVKLISDCVDLLADDAFHALFMPAQTGGESVASGSVQEDIAAVNQ